MTARVFFDNPDDTNRVAQNLDVEKDCDYSISSDLEEIQVAVKQENIPKTSYSIAEIEEPVDRSFL